MKDRYVFECKITISKEIYANDPEHAERLFYIALENDSHGHLPINIVCTGVDDSGIR